MITASSQFKDPQQVKFAALPNRSEICVLGDPHTQLWTYNIKDIRHEKANSLIKTLIGNFTSKVK
ncbi:hypothetical protein J433_00160 [Corynebacterium glutamicum MT]|uniref:Uncharacterized protein n=1 Tax=Corynebacterium glutamicum TaxID=1718 RepID=A0AB36I780_CORGT|nr:hypothetical protein C624_04420 [Corynebacterium glutamicum SCgG1]AGN21494.1 hypothetical protein C629_04420 [Corynebacterium glutamicum SCgG2]EGV39459.1 hypothetical protein CgS9114_13371 [Corynebacterium glutamicum S9114]EOA66110.1 hypothetical protein J433_00160 [Corynebacterium glutamicum MT]EPP41380.1 hypothetical protein A583_03926 [Corynebacterium glutamicum Z188]OKX76853.1 hypothetical protein AUP69_14210 [Corynebacterium glutamicum]